VQDDQRLRDRRARPVQAQAAALTLVALLAGCGGGHANKAGAPTDTPLVLRVAVPDTGDEGPDYFARAVERTSGGRVTVSVDGAYDSTDTAAEAKLAGALEAGEVEAAYMPARDWAVAGVPEFEALGAPFAVTTHAAAQAVAASAFAGDALGALKARHLVGLALVPDEPRRVLSRRPLRSREDFRGAALRVVLAPDIAKAVSALGGRPVTVRRSLAVARRLDSGRLTGAESSPRYALRGGYAHPAPYLTAFAIGAKFQVIAVSERTWAKLSDAQRAAVREAAQATVAHMRGLPRAEQRELADLCREGAVITRSSAAQVAAIAAAGKVDPSGYAAAAAALAKVPGTGPQPLAGDVPSACTAARARTQPARSQTATIPDGVYTTTTTVADLRRGGQYGPDWRKPITWTTRLRGGRVHETQEPDYPDQGPCSGTYEVAGDRVTFTWDPSGACGATPPEVLRWSYYGGQLSFELVDVQDTASKVIYTAHPWRKTG
jgi:TRAP-type transport system periplasmic protein